MKKEHKAQWTFQPERATAPQWRWIFWGLSGIALIAILLLQRHAGVSGDEFVHLDHAEKVYNYYSTWGQDSTAAYPTDSYNLPHYGQAVDNMAYAVGRLFGVDDPYPIRHATNSIFGFLAMLFAGLVAYRLAGWRAACITLVLMFFSPRFLGHSFNNLKDLPLATTMIAGLYYLIRLMEEFPKIKWSSAIGLAIAIGLSIAVRVGGLLLIAYFGLFGLILFFMRNWWAQRRFGQHSGSEFKTLFVWGLCISVVGYFLAVLLWPYALRSPFGHPLETLGNMSKFSIAIRQVFQGEQIWSDFLPWYYTPKFILMTIPIAVIAGMLIYGISLWRDKSRGFGTFMVFFAFFFPVFWIVYSESNVYGGWRHAMFAYPPMVVFAALGFEQLIRQAKQPKLRMVLTALPFILLLGPIMHTIRNHPYEYVYFNELAGGMSKSYGNYEQDYYYHSTREASEWVKSHAEDIQPDTRPKIVVSTWHAPSVNYFFSKDTARFNVGFSRWYERSNNDWDYAIFAITGMSPAQLKNPDVFPPKNTVYQVKVDGRPICIVLKRENRDDFKGYMWQQQKQWDSAQYYYERYLSYDPHNEVVWNNLCEMAVTQGQLDAALVYADKALAIDAMSETAMYFKGYALLMLGRLAESEQILKALTEKNPKQSSALWLLANLYANAGNVMLMDKTIERMLEYHMQMGTEALNLMKRAYARINVNETEATRSFYRMMARVLRKLGYAEDAAQYEAAAR